MKRGSYRVILVSLLFSAVSFAEQTDRKFTDWAEPTWVNPLENVEGEVRISDQTDDTEVHVLYRYPNGKSGNVAAKADAEATGLYRFSIPAELDAGLGVMTYKVEVTHGGKEADATQSEVRKIKMGYEEDLDITANPPEILWFELGDKSAVVRYTACCNILGASVVAKRVPVNPMESGDGLPDTLYSDFVWLEPDALSASTAGLYFEFGFRPQDFKSGTRKHPVIYEYDWLNDIWEPILTFKVVDGDTLDFPATEGGVYVLARR